MDNERMTNNGRLSRAVLLLASLVLMGPGVSPSYAGEPKERLVFDYHIHYFTDKEGVTPQFIRDYVKDLNQALSKSFRSVRGEVTGDIVLFAHAHIGLTDSQEIEAVFQSAYPVAVIAEGEAGYRALQVLQKTDKIPMAIFLIDVPDTSSRQFDPKVQRVINAFGEGGESRSKIDIKDSRREYNILIRNMKQIDLSNQPKLRNFFLDLHLRALLEAITQGFRQFEHVAVPNAAAHSQENISPSSGGELIAKIQEKLKEKPDPRGYLTLGMVYENRGWVDEAKRAYEQAVALDPNLATGYEALGLWHANRGIYPEAEAMFQRALEVKPNDGEVLNNLASVLLVQRKYSQAIEAYQKSLASSPEDPMRQARLGQAYFVAGRLDEAAQVYERVLEKNPQFTAIRSQLAEIRRRRSSRKGR